MTNGSNTEILQRIQSALEASRAVFSRFTCGDIQAEYKAGHDPVTQVDRSVDALLRKELLRDGEGWLSEETLDDPTRLDKDCVWVVDPLDGTREFVDGIPCSIHGFVVENISISDKKNPGRPALRSNSRHNFKVRVDHTEDRTLRRRPHRLHSFGKRREGPV